VLRIEDSFKANREDAERIFELLILVFWWKKNNGGDGVLVDLRDFRGLEILINRNHFRFMFRNISWRIWEDFLVFESIKESFFENW
jgi:hypothetical protein